ncbi:MAG: PAS domain-containing protein [Oscillospiraceae bacterium]
MNETPTLQRYIPLVKFMGAICGTHYEVILHDTANQDESVIAIENGYLSGRKVGDPMTELARGIIQRKEYVGKDFIANYEGRTKDGRQFVSSTYFIKENEQLIGLICVNHDVADFVSISRHLNELMRAFSLPEASHEPPYTENLDDSISNLSNNIIHTTVSHCSVPAPRMTTVEKIGLIRTWDHQGIFSTKGSVAKAARELGISEPTVYRYLKKSRE